MFADIGKPTGQCRTETARIGLLKSAFIAYIIHLLLEPVFTLYSLPMNDTSLYLESWNLYNAFAGDVYWVFFA